jgi:hypothetical protein
MAEEEEVGVRWPPACEDVSLEAEEHPLSMTGKLPVIEMKTMTQNTSLCVIMVFKE